MPYIRSSTHSTLFAMDTILAEFIKGFCVFLVNVPVPDTYEVTLGWFPPVACPLFPVPHNSLFYSTLIVE